MFTSKKAQYLDKDFNNISPITNIDSLYFEKVEKNESGINSEYIVNRLSVTKHMPIQYDNEVLLDIDRDNVVTVNIWPSGQYGQDLPIIHFYKTILPELNPLNTNSGIRKYENDFFEVNSNFVNITHLLNHYCSLDYFNSSIGQINASLNYSQNRAYDISIYTHNVQQYVEDLSTRFHTNAYIYYNGTKYVNISDGIDVSLDSNYIYNLAYPKTLNDPHFYIKIQCISSGNIQDIVSLDVIKAKSINTSFVENWQIQYDISQNKIIYLNDEYGNEGNFDFRSIQINGVNIFGSAEGLTDNSFNNVIQLTDIENSNIQLLECKNNQIYNSKNIMLDGRNDLVCDNNIIRNLNNLLLAGSSNNKLYNSSNYKCVITNGNNNTIINCNDCSINIQGNNNILINLKNQDISLGDNNIIIGDEIGCSKNSSTLTNVRLFLNYSTSTALALDLSTNCTVFGGIGNDVSVYSGGFATTNK